MRLSLIVAMAENRVIGRAGGLPWHLPADLKLFRRLTTGHTIVMGRKTWDAIGRPLPRRRSIVVRRDPSREIPGATVVGSLDEALAVAAQSEGADEVFVIGGADLYALALPRADRVYLTRIHAEIAGDVYFPELDPTVWQRVSAEPYPADEHHAYAFTFEQWERWTGDMDVIPGVLTCGEVDTAAQVSLLARYGLELQMLDEGAPIPGSYWGAPEAGLVGSVVYVRPDTPVHSLLHEACHAILMGEERRRSLHTDAGGDVDEENAVCLLQLLLADHLPGVGRDRLMADMDAWGYTFRLGSTRAWLAEDADDAHTWLRERGWIDEAGGRARLQPDEYTAKRGM